MLTYSVLPTVSMLVTQQNSRPPNAVRVYASFLVHVSCIEHDRPFTSDLSVGICLVQFGFFHYYYYYYCKGEFTVPLWPEKRWLRIGLLFFVGCLTSQQHASVSQGRICSDNFTCCHTEMEVADQTFHLTQSQYTDTGPTSPSTDSVTPGTWQGSAGCANFEVTGMTRPRKNPGASGIRTQDLPLSRQTP